MTDNQQQNSPGVTTNSFSKGMLKDYNDTFVGEGIYTHARNAVNNSHDGQMGVIGNEPSNLSCVTLPYDLIGCIHLFDDQWALFTTDDTNSEIGIFDESACSYKKLINDPCLGFKRSNLITGASRKRYDCERLIYWVDGLNPDRSMDVDNIQQYYNYTDVLVNDCKVRTYSTTINCETLRLSPLIKHPCIQIQRGALAGTLPNGSYQACIAYTVNQLKITDYIGLTAVQGLFTHENVSSSLVVNITEIDTSFDEFELVLLANINSQTTAKRIGYYNTSQGIIYVDRWDAELATVNVGDVVFRSEPIDTTDAAYPTNDYLLKIGTHSKFKFNYQPLANQIRANWVAVQYPADYYIKGGNRTGYMRDEVYPFFIRWVYNTGEFSESYHIPGRASIPTERVFIFGDNVYETEIREVWQVQNTGTVAPPPTVTAPSYLDGGVIIGQGGMSYWESTEKYPDNRPDIWNSFPNNQGSPFNLCGKNIRHHKFPDETISTNNPLPIFGDDGKTITILGVQFENIQPPVDNAGKLIPGVVGYEILRGSREGNKTILGKGLFNNMRTYPIPGNTNTGLMQNYPYNDLRADSYLTTDKQDGTNGSPDPESSKMVGYSKNTFSFHSPEVTFSNPFLNTGEFKIYGEMSGTSYGRFETPYKHPTFKILTDFSSFISKIVSALTIAKVAYDVIVGASTIAGGGINTTPVSIAGTTDLPLTSTLTLPLINSFPIFDIAAGTGVSYGSPAIAAKNAATTIYNIAIEAAFLIFSVPVLEEQITKIIIALVPRRQYAAQYNSHGFYNQFKQISSGGATQIRRSISQSSYVGSSVQQFGLNQQINNINRSRVVVVQTGGSEIPVNPTPDTSRFIMGDKNDPTLNKDHKSTIASYYGALKINIPSQYGQLDSIKQLPVSTCIVNTTSTNVLFGGDIYINRFTEKNTMFFFNSWLMGEPNEYEYDYTQYINVPYPRFWVNNTQKHSFFSLANKYRVLDMRTSSTFFVDRGFFYLFNSGVRDFFVESEVNVAYRDWEDDIPHRHYDLYRFADLTSMFRSDIVQTGNYYKYDYSLSIAKLFNSSISWGNLLPRDYNPLTYASCYTYRPNRVIYSLPQQSGSKKDSWRLFLTNNYKDFPSRVSCIKPINKTGSLFMMAYQGPLSFMGVEELKMDGTGAKITIGDGGLFQQAMQSVTNVDESFEYGSNQGRYCSINTVHGVFWVSQNQGKIFLYANQLKEISASAGMRWWFAKYLPSELLKAFPDYPLYDNPLKGVGVQMMYDNTNDVLYITKKDYKPLRNDLAYDQNGFYYISGTTNTTIPGTTTCSCPALFTLSDTTCTGPGLEPAVPFNSFYGYIVSNVLHVTSVSGTTNIKVGQGLYGTGIGSGITITALGTGTGGVGTYNVNQTSNVGSSGSPIQMITKDNTVLKQYSNFTTVYGTVPAALYNTYNVWGRSDNINPTTSGWNQPPGASTYQNLTGFWANDGKGRLNQVGVWYKDPLPGGFTGQNRDGTLSQTFTFQLTTAKEYYIGLGADNFASLIVNCQTILEQGNSYNITATCSGTTLTVTAIESGGHIGSDVPPPDPLTKPGSYFNYGGNQYTIIRQLSGTRYGLGTYQLTPSLTLSTPTNILITNQTEMSSERPATLGGPGFGVQYKSWNIYKINLQAGLNTVTIKVDNEQGLPGGNYGIMGYEIYDATEARLKSVSSVNDLQSIIAKDSFTGLPITSASLDNKIVGSLDYDCPCGSVVVRGTASNPTYWCPATVTQPATCTTTPSTTIKVPIKTYCNFNSSCWEDASFTISYDCKSETWISFHDWKPTFLIPGRSHFMSVNYNSIWKHNITCTSYCNFYGINYPFEIEFVSATGQTVNSMRSIEYLLEVYNYFHDCRDKFHVLDQNFDQAVIYNSEQISGVLQLNIKPKNNPVAALGYPIIHNSPDYIDILFSKEENKYRFDQFWDITKDRGEYTGVKTPMFDTQANGYIYPINPTYVNYNKPVLQRKKFRHNVNKIFLRKVNSGNNKFLFKLSNQKLLQSPR